MASRFANRERRVTAALDKEFAERTRINPRRRGEFISAAVDPDRAQKIVRGIVDFVPNVFLPKDTSRFDGFQPSLSADASHISYDEALFASKAEWPRAGDLIELIDRPDTPSFAVAAPPESDGIGRIVCRILVSP